MKTNILYLHNNLDHEKNISYLEAKGIGVLSVESVAAAYEMFKHTSIHILFIDLDIKKNNGMDFIRELRKKEILTPAIITMTNADQCNLLEALNLNITQCLIKPYSQQNLDDALKMAMQKAAICHSLTYTDLNFGYAYDPIAKYITSSEGEIIKLCNKEALLIELLIQNGEYITSYEMIENIVWQDSFMSVESLRTLIRGIRQKTHKNIITNHNGIGYIMDLKINLPSLDSLTSYLHHQ